MKKAVSILLVLAMVFSLCACGKSKAATECENLITALGDVDVHSGEAIDAAEKAYAALTKEEQDKIPESAAALADARSAYTFEVSKAAYQNINQPTISSINLVLTSMKPGTWSPIRAKSS